MDEQAGPAWLGYAVVRLAHVLGREMERRLAPLGLTPTTFSALFHLGRSPRISANALARAILVTPQSVGPLLDRLAEDGLVMRERGGPRGAILTSLSAVGRRRLADAELVVASLDDELGRRLPDIDHHALAQQLHRAAEPFTPDTGEPAGPERE